MRLYEVKLDRFKTQLIAATNALEAIELCRQVVVKSILDGGDSDEDPKRVTAAVQHADVVHLERGDREVHGLVHHA